MPFTDFIETGTFQGVTAELVAPLFAQVRTIELSATLHGRASARLAKLKNVACLHGDSPSVLRTLTRSLTQAAVVYWLDAHWCGNETAGRANECPLLNEIDAIGSLNEHSVVLIDDARLFLAPPPAPHDPGHWPPLDEVIAHLRGIATRHRLWVINDVIIFAPQSVSDVIVGYSRTRGVDLNVLAQLAARVQHMASATPAPTGSRPT